MVTTLTLAFLIMPIGINDTHSSCRVIENGHGPGRDMVVVDWKTVSGDNAGEVHVPVTGKGRTGPVMIRLQAMEVLPTRHEWDTREWQWWKNAPFDPDQMRPREVSVTTGGADVVPGGVRVWSRYLCDGIETTQEWFFTDLEHPDFAVYDCLTTVKNRRPQQLEEYGQFFACYTLLNGAQAKKDEAAGHFYISHQGNLVNYRDVGSIHLEYYVTQAGSLFDRLGYIPHCPRGGGKVKDRWKYPVSISLPSPREFRHMVLTEQAHTAAIAQGMYGLAQDYLIYPTDGILEVDGVFSVHIRHLLVRIPAQELLQRVDDLWSEFTNDHVRVHGLSRPVTTDESDH